MIKIWSELPVARVKEQIADVGDWASGRRDRLVRAELASARLRP